VFFHFATRQKHTPSLTQKHWLCTAAGLPVSIAFTLAGSGKPSCTPFVTPSLCAHPTHPPQPHPRALRWQRTRCKRSPTSCLASCACPWQAPTPLPASGGAGQFAARAPLNRAHALHVFIHVLPHCAHVPTHAPGGSQFYCTRSPALCSCPACVHSCPSHCAHVPTHAPSGGQPAARAFLHLQLMQRVAPCTVCSIQAAPSRCRMLAHAPGGGQPAARAFLHRVHAIRVRAVLQDLDRGVGLVRQRRGQAAEGAEHVHPGAPRHPGVAEEGAEQVRGRVGVWRGWGRAQVRVCVCGGGGGCEVAGA